MKYAFIKEDRQIFTITRMCHILDVKPSSYYDWISRSLSEQQIHRNQCELLVRVAHDENKKRYGYEFLHTHLTKQEYAINKHMTADLVCKALNIISKNREPSRDLIVHSDRGSQYYSYKDYKIIKQHSFKGSMSQCGNCFDNAPIESFWNVLKNELVYHQEYETRFEAIKDIIGYIELYYNQTRIQKSLGYRSPRQVWFDFYRQAA